MLRLENIKIREELESEDVAFRACKKSGIDFKDVINYYIYKKSIDARNKDDIFYNYTVDVCVKNEKKYFRCKVVENQREIKLDLTKNRKSEMRPIIVGAGPAGLFCAFILVNNEIKPIVIEQGSRVEERIKEVEEFASTGKL